MIYGHDILGLILSRTGVPNVVCESVLTTISNITNITSNSASAMAIYDISPQYLRVNINSDWYDKCGL